MDWATKRRLKYLIIILGFLIGLGLYFIIPILNKEPTCLDGKQNGQETGVDCGGACALICKDETSPLVVLWSRSFNVAYDLYSAVAYVENQNVNAGIRRISYKFRLYDGNNILITERDGITFIEPNGRTAIFEPGIKTGNRVPRRTSFTFTEEELFVRVGEQNKVQLFSKEPRIESEDTAPKVSAFIENTSSYPVSDIDVIAILYDEFGNALTTSRTKLDMISPNSRLPVFFSWPTPLEAPVRKIEVIPRFNPFQSVQQ